MIAFRPSPAATAVSRRPWGVPGDRARRLLNVSVAAVGLLIAAPLMLLAALVVKLDSPGPVIFRQQRVGAG